MYCNREKHHLYINHHQLTSHWWPVTGGKNKPKLRRNPLQQQIRRLRICSKWRLFRNRLPTRDKLFQRRVLAESDQSCSANCGLNEDEDHLFLNCVFFEGIWQAYCGLVRILNSFAWLFSVSLSSV
uniref:Reverse transcriptase zinc-binding domain-containing protein n=1 Tax=Medicago truncatula TaxID=3880 RepID=Q2HV30_MEDTR|nr:hypothetical protein MtrDRAFT_AC149032g6v2 [Medicago truncatula]